MTIANMVEIAAIGMFFVGFLGLITTNNIIKSVVFIVLLGTGVIVFFLSVGVSASLLPPIADHLYEYGNLVDPLPSALMITAIVIGLSVTAINITMLMTLLRKYRTADWDAVQAAVTAENIELFGEDTERKTC
jgi:multicomponent Na+:H+ antiporter subunit C